ncbi:uncharacterized protein LOC131669235 [Phymastichus coffea]|uniref:uncharacterized protein LOC131669235 n=1 Tax=Phymastichus coffea TaxID=108790 RepID=UPI00273ABB27|nr:uncharacterized protein LOC131669235 [Phymastichus coffea]
MSDDIYKSLLFKFYGFDRDFKKVEKLSTSKGIDIFDNVRTLDANTEQLILAGETETNQNVLDKLDGTNDENNDSTSSKSPHVLTIKDLDTWNKKEFQKLDSELDLTSDLNEKSVNKNLTSSKDTFTKVVANTNDLLIKNDCNTVENSSNLSSTSVLKAKQSWRQKVNLKEIANCPIDLLSKYDGVFLDLNHMGITNFPTDILHHLKNLQMLYLDTNNLKEIPEDLFIILKRLTWLDVRKNQLITLPPTIKGHESLKTLLLQENNIERLPLELGLLPNLKNLQTAYNPIIFPPQEILELDSLSVMKYLRKEWNKLHENEQIELQAFSNEKDDKKPSMIICYQPLQKSLRKNYKYRNLNTSKPSVRLRTWNYKPNSRYNSATLDFTYQQKWLWKNDVKQMLTEQHTKLQKILDKNVLVQWRSSYRVFKNNKISSNDVKALDPPYALHEENSQRKIHNEKKKLKLEYKYDIENFYENFNRIQNSLIALGDKKSTVTVTPRAKQLHICTEIDVINDLQKRINDLKLCMDIHMP